MKNPEINPVSRSNVGTNRNRALDIRRDNDTFVVPSITIYDIDYAIFFHLSERIQPQIEKNGNVVNVPVSFANPEKWVQIQRYGHLRDASSKILTPLIIIKRLSMAPDDRVPKLSISKSDRDNSLIYLPKVQKNNQYDLDRENNQKSLEFYVTNIPQHVRINYELLVWTDSIESLNTIIELINTQDKLPWGDVFQFVTQITDFSFDITNNVGEDRVAKCTISLTVDGILQNEYDLKESNVRKAYSIKRVVFSTEYSDDSTFILGSPPSTIKPDPSRLTYRIKKDSI